MPSNAGVWLQPPVDCAKIPSSVKERRFLRFPRPVAFQRELQLTLSTHTGESKIACFCKTHYLSFDPSVVKVFTEACLSSSSRAASTYWPSAHFYRYPNRCIRPLLTDHERVILKCHFKTASTACLPSFKMDVPSPTNTISKE